MKGDEDRQGNVPRVIRDETEGPPRHEIDDPGEGPAGVLGDAQDEGRRPTPVRMGMESGEEDDDAGTENARTFQDGKTGEEWIARVTGQSSSGILPLRTVPLLEITFARAQEPDRPLRQALGYGTNLGRISDQELLSLLQRSDPFKEPIQEIESQDRKGRKVKNQRGPRG